MDILIFAWNLLAIILPYNYSNLPSPLQILIRHSYSYQCLNLNSSY